MFFISLFSLKKIGRLIMFSYCVAKLMAYILLPWRFMPDYVEEGTEAEIGAAANIFCCLGVTGRDIEGICVLF